MKSEAKAQSKAQVAQLAIKWTALNAFIRQLKNEDILIIEGYPFVIRPASLVDIKRINAEIVLDNEVRDGS